MAAGHCSGCLGVGLSQASVHVLGTGWLWIGTMSQVRVELEVWPLDLFSCWTGHLGHSLDLDWGMSWVGSCPGRLPLLPASPVLLWLLFGIQGGWCPETRAQEGVPRFSTVKGTSAAPQGLPSVLVTSQWGSA